MASKKMTGATHETTAMSKCTYIYTHPALSNATNNQYQSDPNNPKDPKRPKPQLQHISHPTDPSIHPSLPQPRSSPVPHHPLPTHTTQALHPASNPAEPKASKQAIDQENRDTQHDLNPFPFLPFPSLPFHPPPISPPLPLRYCVLGRTRPDQTRPDPTRRTHQDGPDQTQRESEKKKRKKLQRCAVTTFIPSRCSSVYWFFLITQFPWYTYPPPTSPTSLWTLPPPPSACTHPALGPPPLFPHPSSIPHSIPIAAAHYRMCSKTFICFSVQYSLKIDETGLLRIHETGFVGGVWDKERAPFEPTRANTDVSWAWGLR